MPRAKARRNALWQPSDCWWTPSTRKKPGLSSLTELELEEFDFESASRRQLRGNIYLAKVTRVEPSLQAAFIEYGGNRHGFLAFSEIHPDYYQIPVADREALLRDEEEEAEREEARAAAADAAEEQADEDRAAADGIAPTDVREAADDLDEDGEDEDGDGRGRRG